MMPDQSHRKVVVAIPCYNCGPQLGRVLDAVDDRLTERVDQFWVVDNRSADDTVEVALERRRSGRLGGLRVFRNDRNVNLGGTQKIVFDQARSDGFTHVVVLHGDAQATTAEVHDLLDELDRGAGSTVLGSRFSRRSRLLGYDRKRIVGNLVLNGLYSAAAVRPLQDLGSGLNLFAVGDLDPSTYRLFDNGLTFNFELLLDLVRRRVRFVYLPITWTESDQVSNARNWRVFSSGLAILARWRLGRPLRPTGEPVGTWTEVEA